jgi:ribosome-associated protein YbcJ (S4-like RNA binding protein)
MVAVDGETKERRGTRIRREERIGAATMAAAGCRAANHPRGTGCLP